MTEENLKGGQPNSLHNVPNLVSDEERTAFNPNSRGMTRNNPQLTYLQSHLTENAKFAHDVENEDDKRPPNIEKCKIHKKAKKVYARGLESDKSSVPGQRPVCSCCGNEYGPHLRKLGLCCSRSDFYHLGAGFPLYFEFIIFCSLLICIMMIISGIYNVVTNNDDHDCAANIGLERKDRTFCDLNWITRLSLVNKRYSVTELEISNWLNLGTIAVMMIAFHFYRRQTILTIQEVDNSQQTPSDYTIMIKNLPLDATDEEIKTFFEKEVFFEKQVQIAKIVRGFNIGDFIKLQRRKNAIFYELGKEEVKNRQKLEAELEDVKKRLDVLEKNCNTQLEHSPFAFVTFEEEGDAREALRRLGFSSVFKKVLFYLGCYGCFSDLKFRGRDKLNVHRAPEPSDIIWENLGTSDSDQRKRRFISLIVSIILILITGGIIIAINVGKSKLTNPTDIENTNQQQTRGFGTEVISVVISLVIMFINNSLNFSTRVFASYESRSTYTSYFVSVARRLSLCTFINTAITLLVTNYILDTLWKNGGLLNDVVVVYVINAGVGPLLNIFNPWYFYRLYRRRQIAMQGDKCPLTQKEANLIFEGPPVDMAQMYAMAVKTLWTTAFFAPVLPISIPIPLINMLLAFWVDKYLLLRRNAKPTELSKGLCVWMTEFLELTPFIFAAGNIIFRSMIINNDITNTDVSVLPSILCLALGAAFVLFPLNPLAKLCFKSEDNEGFKKSTYTQMRVQFNNDYDIANPVYHDEALESWLDAVEQAEIQQNNQNNPKAEMLKQIVQQEINPGQLAEADKNIQLLRNLKAYAKRMKGLEVGAHNNNRPQGPNQAMMFYKVDPNAAKIGNFIMHPKLHVPNQANFNPQAQFGVNAASTTQPGAVQLNFEKNPTLNQQQNVPQSQPYQPRPMGYPGPQYQPQGPAPQYNPQLQGQGMPPRYMQGPGQGQGQPFVPPQGGQQGYYPAPQMQQQYPMNIQMVPMNNNQPMGQPMNYRPGYQNHPNQGFQGQFPQN